MVGTGFSAWVRQVKVLMLVRQCGRAGICGIPLKGGWVSVCRGLGTGGTEFVSLWASVKM